MSTKMWYSSNYGEIVAINSIAAHTIAINRKDQTKITVINHENR